MKVILYTLSKKVRVFHCKYDGQFMVKTLSLVVIVLDPSGWWHGICRGKTGLFPSNYVQVH